MTFFQDKKSMNINFAKLEIAGESNIGPVRRNNEDNFLIYAPPGGHAVLAAVADGIGGHSRGEVASAICCNELLKAAYRTDSRSWGKDFLQDALLKANKNIFDLNYQGKRIKPMGCTVAAAVFFRDRVIISHAGDSRFYEYTDDADGKVLHQLTEDHRPEGLKTLVNAERFRNVSLISRSVGTGKFLELDTCEIPRRQESKYLICSDGLYNSQSSQFLCEVLGADSTMRQKVSFLVRNALLAGEKDNITVICAGSANEE